jgi:hypothetical protein
MPTREELHELIDSLPEEAIGPAHSALTQLKGMSPAALTRMEEMRKEMETRRQEFGQGRAPLLAKLSFGTSSGSFDPKTGTASSSHRYLDGDTSVTETMRRHKVMNCISSVSRFKVRTLSTSTR